MYFESRGFIVTYNDQIVPKGNVVEFKSDKSLKPGERPMLGSFRFPEKVTWYQVWHEMAHYVHYKRVGPEEWHRASLTKVEREQFVYDLLRSARRWNKTDAKGRPFINFKEKIHAVEYILDVGGRGDPK